MKKNEPDNLRELSWRSTLTPEKETQLRARLAGHPEVEAAFQEEVRLTQLLGQLPDAPLPSNFTSRVLRAIEREEATVSREHKRGWPAWWTGFGWVSRFAMAGFVLAAGFLTIHQGNISARRNQLAHSVETVSQVAALPTDWLANFDTINRLSQPVPADQELLAMLQ